MIPRSAVPKRHAQRGKGGCTATPLAAVRPSLLHISDWCLITRMLQVLVKRLCLTMEMSLISSNALLAVVTRQIEVSRFLDFEITPQGGLSSNTPTGPRNGRSTNLGVRAHIARAYSYRWMHAGNVVERRCGNGGDLVDCGERSKIFHRIGNCTLTSKAAPFR
jgi:hypothetical protein